MIESTLDSFESKKPLSVKLKKIQKLSGIQVERIAKLSIKALSKIDSLSNACEYIATSLKVMYGNEQSWICMASADPNMCGYIFKCKGYVQFMLSDHYFLVACIST